MRSRTWLILFLAIILCSEVVGAGPCDPPPQIATFFRGLPDNPRNQHWSIEERLDSSPDDFWLNRLFLESSIYERDPIREKYRRRLEAHTDSLDDRYLYARSLVGFNTKEALRIYSAILEKDSDYPWVHYSQLEIYRHPMFLDRAKLSQSFDALVRVCPAWIEPYRYLADMDDSAVATRATQLRTMLQASSDPKELKLYTTLWTAEFRVLPKSDHEAERQRIASDLKRLSQFDGVQAVIANGAKLIGDDALAKRMTLPRTTNLLMTAFEEWRRRHIRPAVTNPPEKLRAYAEAQLEASTRWMTMAPDVTLGYTERFAALVALGAPLEQIAQAGEGVEKIGRRNDIAGRTAIVGVALTYVERRILLDRVPDLIDEALVGFDDAEAAFESDLRPAAEITPQRMDLVSRHVSAVATLSQCYEAQGQLEKARSVLTPVPAYLAAKAVVGDAGPNSRDQNILRSAAIAHYAYWTRLGELDERDGKKEDALNDYREALKRWNLQSGLLLSKQRRLWKDLGRSDQDWQAWVDSIPPPVWTPRPTTPIPEFVMVHRVLPKIALKDLDGNAWPTDRFVEKTTIAVVWATWCGPCVKELRFFAKLADQLKERRGVQVISFNIDENLGLAEEFVHKHGYTFPVLPALSFAEDLMPYLSIPRTWIIREGAIVEESEGFANDGDQWVDRLIARVK